MRLTLKIWRQKSPNDAGRFETYEAREPDAYDDTLTKAEASKRIDALQEKTGRGVDH